MSKKLLSLLLAVVIIFMVAFTGCTAKAPTGDLATAEPKIVPDTDLSGEITVSAYDTMFNGAFLEEAAKAFETKYPNTKVNVDTFSKMPEMKTSTSADGATMAVAFMEDDTAAQSDYTNRVSTELMSGSGADVLAMDILPAYKYAANGQLENLTNYMEADSDFKSEDYLSNIFDATKINNSNYYLPLDYMFDYYAYDSTLLDSEAAKTLANKDSVTTNELLELGTKSFDKANANSDNPIKMFAMDPEVMLEQLFSEDYTNMVDVTNKTANFTDGAFKDLLEKTKSYIDSGYIQPLMKNMVGESEEITEEFLAEMDALSAAEFLYKLNNSFSLSEDYKEETGRDMVFSTRGAGGSSENDTFATLPADNNGQIPFEYSQAYGINSNSQNKALAWAFIKFLLSEEMQSSTNIMPMAMPVNNNARSKRAEMILSGEAFGGMTIALPAGLEGEEIPEFEPDPVSTEKLAAYKELIETLSAKLNYYPTTDTIIENMVRSETEYFFNGGKTADQVAEALQTKVTLYLNE